MDRTDLLAKVQQLSNEGKSIRSIATELGVHRNRVHRALNAVKSAAVNGKAENGALDSQIRTRESVFVGRRRHRHRGRRGGYGYVIGRNGRLKRWCQHALG